MYVPAPFIIEERATMRAIVAGHPLATLATNGPQGPVATQLPLMIVTGEDGRDTILGHFARANPQWREADGAHALAVFRGADGYVTPDWYPTKRETGKVVPTWNYVTVQARGRIELVTEPEAARAIVARLTDAMERPRAAPWAMEDAPAPFIGAMMRGLVTFRMPVDTLTGQAKLSQNKGEADRDGVRAGLGRDDAMLGAMERWT